MSKGLVALGSDPADFRSIGNGLFGTEGAIPSSLEELINLEQVEEAIFQERQRRYDANIAAEIVLEKTRTDAEAKRLAPAHTDDGSEGMFERSDSQTTTFSEAEERDRPDDADRGREERSEDEDGVRKESVGLERHVAESSSNPPRAEWREKDPAEEAMAHKKRLISLTPLPRLLVAKERDEVRPPLFPLALLACLCQRLLGMNRDKLSCTSHQSAASSMRCAPHWHQTLFTWSHASSF